jgi:hypothetical protein
VTTQRILTPEHRRQAYLRETGRIKMAEAMEPPTPLLPRHLPPSRPGRPPESRTLIQAAEADGHWAGFYDRHWADKNYQTGAEYIAWYKGWKQGQKDRN